MIVMEKNCSKKLSLNIQLEIQYPFKKKKQQGKNNRNNDTNNFSSLRTRKGNYE